MKFTELKNDIQEGAKSIYLLEGDDAYFRLKGEEMIKSAFVQMPELNFTSLDGETLKGNSMSQLVAAVESVPFMSEKRLVKVTEFHPSDTDFDKHLKNTFENFPQETILLIVNSEGRKGVDLKRKSYVTYVDCNCADEETVTKWAYITLRNAKISASVDVCTLIARYCQCNMSRVALEVEKLIDYKKEGELSREEVDALVYKDTDYRIYEMTNAVSRRDFDTFCTIEADLCRKVGDETSVLSGLFSYFKNLLTIISSDSSDRQLSELLKMKEYGVKKSREQARAIGEDKLKILIADIYCALADIKCGNSTPHSALQTVNNKIFLI
ncbi:MAG: DNA polymerase III subunit delta [Clostridia bacterium]|nr:DNA polymerase III subunit delta [Clostridia bacterium]